MFHFSREINLILETCYFDASHTKSALLYSPKTESNLGMKYPTPLKIGFEGGFHIRADLESDSDLRSDLMADFRADSNSEGGSRGTWRDRYRTSFQIYLPHKEGRLIHFF
jgi:hypothetical protein